MEMQDFVNRCQSKPTTAARVLGVDYSALSAWLSGRRPTPWYITRSIRAHMLLSDRRFRQIISETDSQVLHEE